MLQLHAATERRLQKTVFWETVSTTDVHTLSTCKMASSSYSYRCIVYSKPLPRQRYNVQFVSSIATQLVRNNLPRPSDADLGLLESVGRGHVLVYRTYRITVVYRVITHAAKSPGPLLIGVRSTTKRSTDHP